jgi:type II secretion system protein H
MRRTSERPRSKGFTLIELMVVIAIIAALAAAFPLAMNRFVAARRVDAAARELVADIRLAQARSVSSGKAVAIEPTAHGYRLLALSGATPEVVRSRDWRSSTVVSIERLDGSPGADRLRVFADGSSTGATFTIRDGARSRIVHVSELSGRVRIEPANAPKKEPS